MDAVPLIRSGNIFTTLSDDDQSLYFDTVASASADQITPEHVFGTNGWQRRLAETGADPDVARQAFNMKWESIPVPERKALVAGKALERYGMQNIELRAADAEMGSRVRTARAIAPQGKEVAGLLALDDPASFASVLSEKLFGPSTRANAMYLGGV